MKAQSELLGLVMVVLLLSIILLFVIGFVAFNPPADPSEQFRYEYLATATNDAILRTTVDNCRLTRISDLLIDCAQNPLAPRVSCGGVTSCNILNSSTGPIPKMLNSTLDSWGIRYIYRAEAIASVTGDVTPIFRFGETRCSGNVDAQDFFIESVQARIRIRMSICH